MSGDVVVHWFVHWTYCQKFYVQKPGLGTCLPKFVPDKECITSMKEGHYFQIKLHSLRKRDESYSILVH